MRVDEGIHQRVGNVWDAGILYFGYFIRRSSSAAAKNALVDSIGQRNSASNRAAGVSKSSVFRGRAFSLAAI